MGGRARGSPPHTWRLPATNQAGQTVVCLAPDLWRRFPATTSLAGLPATVSVEGAPKPSWRGTFVGHSPSRIPLTLTVRDVPTNYIFIGERDARFTAPSPA